MQLHNINHASSGNQQRSVSAHTTPRREEALGSPGGCGSSVQPTSMRDDTEPIASPHNGLSCFIALSESLPGTGDGIQGRDRMVFPSRDCLNTPEIPPHPGMACKFSPLKRIADGFQS